MMQYRLYYSKYSQKKKRSEDLNIFFFIILLLYRTLYKILYEELKNDKIGIRIQFGIHFIYINRINFISLYNPYFKRNI